MFILILIGIAFLPPNDHQVRSKFDEYGRNNAPLIIENKGLNKEHIVEAVRIDKDGNLTR